MKRKIEINAMQGKLGFCLARGAHWATELSGRAKAVLLIVADAVLISFALILAVALHAQSIESIWGIGFQRLAAIAVSAIVVFALGGLYRTVLRHFDSRAVRSITLGVTVSVLAAGLVLFFSDSRSLPFAALGTYWAFALLFVAGSRFLARGAFEKVTRGGLTRERVVIYGAGDAGVSLLSVLRARRQYHPVAFVDDKRSLQYRTMNGVRVFPSEQLPELVRSRRVQQVLLALPAASRRRRQEIVLNLETLGVRVQSVPDLTDIVSGRAKIDEFRDVEVSDLLGREAVPPVESLFRSCITGKSVMVTGAGGSIGSELCRQIIQLSPRRLVLFEFSEYALYRIEQELRGCIVSRGLQIELLPLLGSVHHRQRVRDVMFSCDVQTVYHAAAYKHVPLVEHNMIEGLHNNVVGTWYTAEASLDANVESFVLVSTDKAVNPTNIMGATKRFAELVLQALQSRSAKTRFCMVRFGNVLDSSGSVVPLFREQIRRGGPVTVTHPEVIRYFMTIPEAAQLVIQAGAMSQGGDVFVLDMGQPVRIDNLARQMIALMGRSVRDESHPDGDIEIRYTGLRTAEKLYEELLIGTNVTGTSHPRIMRAIEHSLPWERLQLLLDELLAALASYDCRRALLLLTEAVAEYEPESEICDYVWRRRAMIPLPPDSKISQFPRRRSAESA